MFREKIPAGQLSAWLFTAIVPPLIQIAGGASWSWLLAAGIGCLVLNWARGRWGSGELPKWWALPLFVLTVMVLGELAALSAGSWPVGDSYPAVPLILLPLAAWSASKGVEAAARVGVVLFWFVIIMYLFLFAAGVGQVRREWLGPSEAIPKPMSLVLLLVPSAAGFLPHQRGRHGKLVLGLGVVVAAQLLIGGVLSPEIAAKETYAFYETSRSLELLGIARRFEALTCAAATVGWFVLLAFLLSVAGSLFQQLKPGWSRGGVWVAALLAAAWLLCGLHISGGILAGACAVFWVGLPIMAQGIGKIKKS